MKKFFTLMVAAFAAVCSFAQSRTTLWEGEQIMDATWPNIGVELSNLVALSQGVKRFILQRFQCRDKGRNVHRTMIANTLLHLLPVNDIPFYEHRMYLILTAFVLQGRAMLQIID